MNKCQRLKIHLLHDLRSSTPMDRVDDLEWLRLVFMRQTALMSCCSFEKTIFFLLFTLFLVVINVMKQPIRV